MAKDGAPATVLYPRTVYKTSEYPSVTSLSNAWANYSILVFQSMETHPKRCQHKHKLWRILASGSEYIININF